MSPAGRRLAPTANPARSLFSASSTGCSPVACQGRVSHAHQQRAYRLDGIDQALQDDLRSTRPTLSVPGCDDLAQPRAKFGIGHGVLGCELGELLQQLLVLLCPIHEVGNIVGAAAPQVGHSALELEDDLVGGREQAVTQEAAHFECSFWLLDPGADRRGPLGHAPCVTTHQHIVETPKCRLIPRSVRNAMRSKTSLIWRVECLASALQSQLWQSGRGAFSADVQRMRVATGTVVILVWQVDLQVRPGRPPPWRGSRGHAR